MNKKPGLLFSVVVFTIIIVAASFHFSLESDKVVKLAANVNPDKVLYVCSAGSSTWDQIGKSLHLLARFAPVFFSFAGIVVLFSWGWALYQNLLKDKFSEDVYKNPWGLTKVIFWMMVVFTVIYASPNHYRRIDLRGSNEAWVLCENNSQDARAVPYKNVSLH